MNRKRSNQIVRIQDSKCLQDRIEKDKNNGKVTLWSAMFVNQVFLLYYFASSIVTSAINKHLLTFYTLPILFTLPSDTNFTRTEHNHITIKNSAIPRCGTTCLVYSKENFHPLAPSHPILESSRLR